MPRQVVVIARDNTNCSNFSENHRHEYPVKLITVSANPWKVMSRKFSNTLKIAQNIPSDFTVKFSLLNASKGNLCFFGRIYDIFNGKITNFFKADLCLRTCEFVRIS